MLFLMIYISKDRIVWEIITFTQKMVQKNRKLFLLIISNYDRNR
jgi:hypothetical protein